MRDPGVRVPFHPQVSHAPRAASVGSHVITSGATSGEPHAADAPAPGDRLGRRLRERRRQLRLTQWEVARRLGRTQSVVSRWESDDLAMTAHELLRTAGVLDVDPDDLLHGSRLPGDRRVRSSRAEDTGVRRLMGRRLAARRVQAGLDPVAVWRRTGVTPYRLARIERGIDPSLDELRRLLAVLDLRLSVACGARS